MSDLTTIIHQIDIKSIEFIQDFTPNFGNNISEDKKGGYINGKSVNQRT
jgi:hypothetical protein